MSWRAYLEGRQLDLDLLEDQFDRGGAVVGHDEDGHWVESPNFEGLTDPADVQRAALGVLNGMNGVAALVYESYRPVKLNDHFRDGAGSTFVLLTGAVVVTSDLAAELEVRGPNGELIPPLPPPSLPPPPPTPGPDYLSVAMRDPNVREVLDLLAGGPGDWVTLYKVYEVIKDDGDHTRWASRATWSAFTGSANLASVSGSGARHARPRSGGPQHTMSLDQARTFIRGVVVAWLLSK